MELMALIMTLWSRYVAASADAAAEAEADNDANVGANDVTILYS